MRSKDQTRIERCLSSIKVLGTALKASTCLSIYSQTYPIKFKSADRGVSIIFLNHDPQDNAQQEEISEARIYHSLLWNHNNCSGRSYWIKISSRYLTLVGTPLWNTCRWKGLLINVPPQTSIPTPLSLSLSENFKWLYLVICYLQISRCCSMNLDSFVKIQKSTTV